MTKVKFHVVAQNAMKNVPVFLVRTLYLIPVAFIGEQQRLSAMMLN